MLTPRDLFVLLVRATLRGYTWALAHPWELLILVGFAAACWQVTKPLRARGAR